MSSKSGEETNRTGSEQTKYWSITGRLILHYALSAFVLLSLSSVLLYMGLVKSLARQSDRYIQDQINVTRTMLETAQDESELEKDFEVEYAAREFTKTYGRIVDKNGKIIVQTYRMGQIIPVAAFPHQITGVYPTPPVKWKSPEGRTYFLQAAEVSLGGSNGKRETLQIALDVSSLEHTLEDYRTILTLVVAFGTLISALVGAFLVKRGMKPILEMTERTRHITAFNLNERINLEHWPAELKNLGHNFDEMLDRFKEAFDRLSNHVSILAHELRNPINVLVGEAEVALTKARTAEEYRSVIESSLEEYGRLTRMIDSLLFIARFDIKESSLKREEIDVCPELNKLADFYSALADDKEVVVDCVGDIWLFADAALFRRAVGNLLSNSLRYSPGGGLITVSARYAADLSVEITVADTGCGIKKEDLPHIFDRFYRAETTRSLAPEGTGLGLAIVKSIMEHHGGSIDIESEPGKGTSITLKFPLPEDDDDVTTT